MIKITLEFNSYAEAVAALKLIGNVGLSDAVGAVDAPKPPAAGKPAAVKPAPAPTPAASSPAPTPSAAPARLDDPKPEDLTKLVVAAVGRVGREKVVAHLRDVYNVAKGAEITDVPTRIKAIASVSAL